MSSEVVELEVDMEPPRAPGEKKVSLVSLVLFDEEAEAEAEAEVEELGWIKRAYAAHKRPKISFLFHVVSIKLMSRSN